MSRDYDVIVIGGGGAGFSAALSARAEGASVLVIEAGDKPGGSSAISGGVVYAAGTSVQRAAGITDSPDGMYEYYMTLSQWNLEPYLIRRMADESAPVVEWLIGLGVEFRPEKLYCAGVDSVPRGHMTEGAGHALFQRLEQAAAARGVDTALRTRAEQLLCDAEGRVIGVRAGGADVLGGAVVVACGGIGHNKELLRQHQPSVSMHGDWVFYFGGPHNQGDALQMGQATGAAITGHDRGGPVVTPNFTHSVDARLI